MKLNRRLSFTEEAENDLRLLLACSEEAWGEKQRDVYSERLSNAMNELLTHPTWAALKRISIPDCVVASFHVLHG